jgi:glycosyltransferase
MIVVDGGSTDGTLELLASFAHEEIVSVSGPDRGIYDAMNKGLALFSGEAVGFLNSDDRFKDAGSLSAIAAALLDAEIAFGHLDFVADHEGGRVTRQWRSTPFRRGAFRNGWMPPHPTFYMRREVVDVVGKFELGFRIAADYDYMLRSLELHAFRSSLVDRVLVEMQRGGKSNDGIRASIRHNFDAFRCRRKRLGVGVFDPALFAKPLRKLPQFIVR